MCQGCLSGCLVQSRPTRLVVIDFHVVEDFFEPILADLVAAPVGCEYGHDTALSSFSGQCGGGIVGHSCIRMRLYGFLGKISGAQFRAHDISSNQGQEKEHEADNAHSQPVEEAPTGGKNVVVYFRVIDR